MASAEFVAWPLARGHRRSGNGLDVTRAAVAVDGDRCATPAADVRKNNLDMVIWITGLSGSGKSTLCQALRARLKPLRPSLVMLDGDAVRAAFGDDLGYHETDRIRQIKRLQGIARMLVDQGVTVLVAALYAHPDLSAWNRANLRSYFEVYLRADVDFLLGRDGKGLYDRARRGEISNVVGVDIPWHAPTQPDLVIDVTSMIPADALAEQVLQKAMAKAASRSPEMRMTPA
jgi:adenylyl-sulfate kinase